LKTINSIIVSQWFHLANKGDDTMKKTTLLLLILIVISTLFVAGCTQVPGAQPAPQATSPSTPLPVTQLPDTVKKADTAFGAILVDAQGKTLYYFTLDQYANGASACDAACAQTWPVFFTDSIRVSSPLTPADFAFITRADGSKQTTYKGIPLYFYSGDSKPGDINGSGINKVWYVANIAGTVPTTPPTPTPTAIRTPSLAGGGGGGGGGY
jgi:predicted lipoprotein with Yx(FWY)xxD motif